jgi:hypothetical protein
LLPDDGICKSNNNNNGFLPIGAVAVGHDIKTVHAGTGITMADWDRSLAIFVEVLTKLKVPEKDQKDLAGLLPPLEKDIVQK